MIELHATTPQRLEEQALRSHVSLPIEQTAAWMRYQNGINGRSFWGSYVVTDHGEPLAFISLVMYHTHGYRYLRSLHGPAWVLSPTPELERRVARLLVDEARRHDPRIIFLRLDLWHHEGTYPVLSTVPYDQTVVIDLTGGDDEILSRMKRRGRRDVRKALRECPAECADETRQAMADFSDYYDIMVETAARDGFVPAPMSDYTDMIEALGEDHCRVFAARIDGRVAAWSIITVNGTHAVRYYAGMRSEAMRQHVTDRLLFEECRVLGAQGITEYDLMGIGSDFAPSLKGLNEFKTKFAEQTTHVAPGRDVPAHRIAYAALRLLRSLRRASR